MRVAFDLDPILTHRFSGFYAYGIGLLQGFKALEEKPELLLFHSRRFPEQVKLLRNSLGDWAQSKPTSIKMRLLEDFWRFGRRPRLEYFTGPFDIYHCCHHLMPPTKNKPRILTVYDLRRYKLPQLYTKSKLQRFELAVKRADHFIAISHATKDDLCEVFNIAPCRVDVVYLAADEHFSVPDESEKYSTRQKLSKQLGIELDNYIITFSSPDRRKNICRTIKAFIAAKKDLPDKLKLLVVGNLPKNDDQLESLLNPSLDKRVYYTGTVDDITNLLRCSTGLVFASLYEGFGIPILEAFSCGVPVITSNCSSMPEVAGDAALYVDPYDTSSIAKAIVKITNNTETREKLINLGLQRLRNFNWRKTAEQTLEVYKKLL